MFRWPTLVLSLIIVLFVSWLAWTLALPSREDYEEYLQLMEKAKPAKSDVPTPQVASKQTRKQVQREFFWNTPTGRLQTLLRYDNSSFSSDKAEDRREVIENMQHLTGYMQEELYYQLKDGREVIPQDDNSWKLRNGDPYLPTAGEESSWKSMQVIRYFAADTADYYYNSNLLIANQVDLIRFKAPGHLLVTTRQGYKPLVQGVARAIECSFAEGKPNFKAIELKASFTLKERPL
jgi:hypothetical protein